MSDIGCPICENPAGCKGYPHMWEKLRSGENPEHWMAMHSDLNGAPMRYPSMMQMAGNVARAAVKFAASGGKTVDEEEKARRLETCHGCDRFDAAKGRCVECGCFLAWKAAMESENCPIGKW